MKSTSAHQGVRLFGKTLRSSVSVALVPKEGSIGANGLFISSSLRQSFG
jgi:hypothetical protein